MPAPASPTYSVAAKIAAHQAFVNLIDAGATNGFLRIRDAADVLLAEIPLNDPCATINGTTGQISFAVVNTSDSSANATGTAAYGQFCDSAGTVHLSVPTQAGTTPVNGYLVLNSLSIITGGPVTLVSMTIG